MEALCDRASQRYAIVDEIGRGSMGAVYLARDRETGEEVALKTLTEGGSLDDDDLERLRRLFLNEASAGSLLSHPGIVRIRDLVDEPGTPEVFLVMDFVPGSSLAEILARPDPLPFDFVVNVIGGVADVLDHVHAHGVVHRDIKPANILVSSDARIKVTDFGIAELGGQDLSEDLRRSGTPNYMAPERVLGGASDYRADIWGLGVVLYEMLTRRLPFEGESVAEVVTRIAADEPEPLDCHGGSVLPGVQQIVDRALAKEAEERYQFAGELARELKAVQEGQAQLSATLPAAAIPEIDTEAAEATAETVGTAGRWSLRSLVGWVRGPLPGWSPRSLVGWARRHRRLAGAALIVLALSSLWMVVLGRSSGAGVETAAGDVSEVRRQRLEYLALLEEARVMLERGESAAALELFARAEELSPDARRIRALRDEVREQAAREVAAEVAREAAALVGVGEIDLAEGRLDHAAVAARRALKLEPGHPEAMALAEAVDRAKRNAWLRAQQARLELERAEPEPLPVPEPEPRLRVEEPIQPPVAAPAPTYSDLKIDFYSALPRGVLTVYRDETQILRRAFRFVEKKGFMRSQGISGGFDEQVRVAAGSSDFRVYLSLPNRATQVYRLSGLLPAGAIRALQVRVDAAGALDVTLH